MTGLAPGAAVKYARTLKPGLLVTALVAMAAVYPGSHDKGSVLLFALLLGLALHFISEDMRCAADIQLALKDVTQLGWRPVATTLLVMLGFGWTARCSLDGDALITRTGECR